MDDNRNQSSNNYFQLDIQAKIQYWEDYRNRLKTFIEDETYFGRLSQDSYNNILVEIESIGGMITYLEKEYLAANDVLIHKTYKSGESLFKRSTKHPDPEVQKVIENEDPNKYNPNK